MYVLLKQNVSLSYVCTLKQLDFEHTVNTEIINLFCSVTTRNKNMHMYVLLMQNVSLLYACNLKQLDFQC